MDNFGGNPLLLGEEGISFGLMVQGVLGIRSTPGWRGSYFLGVTGMLVELPGKITLFIVVSQE